MMAHLFEHVEKAKHIALDIRARVFDAVANACLRGKMHDNARFRLRKQPRGKGFFRQISLKKRKVRVFRELTQPRALERRIVIVIHAVRANDFHALLEQPLRQMVADKSRRTRDQNRSSVLV